MLFLHFLRLTRTKKHPWKGRPFGRPFLFPSPGKIHDRKDGLFFMIAEKAFDIERVCL
jgi:hypothetical protein